MRCPDGHSFLITAQTNEVVMPPEVIIRAGTTRNCVNLSNVNDGALENDEVVVLSLVPAEEDSSVVNVVGIENATIIIINDDGKICLNCTIVTDGCWLYCTMKPLH